MKPSQTALSLGRFYRCLIRYTDDLRSRGGSWAKEGMFRGGGGGTGHGKVVTQVKRGVLAAASDIVCFKVRPRLVSQPNAGGSGQGRPTSLRLSWG